MLSKADKIISMKNTSILFVSKRETMNMTDCIGASRSSYFHHAKYCHASGQCCYSRTEISASASLPLFHARKQNAFVISSSSSRTSIEGQAARAAAHPSTCLARQSLGCPGQA